MITTALDITRKRGDNYAIRFRVTENGIAMDITGATFRFTVDTRKDPPATDTSTQVFQVTGAIISPATNGIFEFVPTTVQMGNLTPKTYFFDVEMTRSGQVATLVKGKFIIQQDITK